MSNALVILCGGDSSRMGSDKALLPFKDKCMIEYIVDRFKPYFDKIYLSVKQRGDYIHLNFNIREIPDIYNNAGPMGGVLSSLTMISEDRAFFMSVDTPFLDPATALYLLEESGDYDITSFNLKAPYLDLICGVYRKHCIMSLGKCLFSGNVSKSNFEAKCYTNIIDTDEIPKHSTVPIEQQFFSIKDRDDYYMAVFSILKGNFM